MERVGDTSPQRSPAIIMGGGPLSMLCKRLDDRYASEIASAEQRLSLARTHQTDHERNRGRPVKNRCKLLTSYKFYGKGVKLIELRGIFRNAAATDDEYGLRTLVFYLARRTSLPG
jgi:hypothetical protein